MYDRKHYKREMLRNELMTKIWNETGNFVYIPPDSKDLIDDDEEVDIPDQIIEEMIDEDFEEKNEEI